MTLFAMAPSPGFFIELGGALVGLSLLTRLAARFGFSSVPLYLLGGLAFGTGGLLPLSFSESFIAAGAELGVVLLLFLLGLEYTGEELAAKLRAGLGTGAFDLALNFAPGFVAGLALGFAPVVALVLGGATAVSSSGIAAKLIDETGARGKPEAAAALTVLVLEDLAMAVFLPVVAVLLSGRGPAAAAAGVGVALAVVGGVLVAALRYGPRLSALVAHRSDEVVLLTAFGLMLVVAGLAERAQVSAAVGAFLAGVALSGSVAERAYRLLSPTRDLFAALFFLFFGLQTDPRSLPPVLLPAAALALVGVGTKFAAGRVAVARAGGDSAAGWRAGALLVARGVLGRPGGPGRGRRAEARAARGRLRPDAGGRRLATDPGRRAAGAGADRIALSSVE